MMNYKRTCLLLLLAALATNEFPLYDGIELAWNYPANETIAFNLSVPLSLIDQKAISWLFIALRPSAEDKASNFMDVVFVNLTSDVILDEFPNFRGFPQPDSDFNGTDDLFDKSAEIIEINKYFTWSRYFFSNDTKDVNLISGQLYALMWVYGNIDQNGKWTVTKSGSQPFTLTNGRALHGEDKGHGGDHKGDNRGGDRGNDDNDDHDKDNDSSNSNGEPPKNNNGEDNGSNDPDTEDKSWKRNPLMSGAIEGFIMQVWILSIYLVL